MVVSRSSRTRVGSARGRRIGVLAVLALLAIAPSAQAALVIDDRALPPRSWV